MKTITIQDFQKKLDKETLNIVDVRSPKAYADAHIQESENIPLAELENQLLFFDKEKEYYLICYSGNFSKQATQLLNRHGIRAINVESGMAYFLI